MRRRKTNTLVKSYIYFALLLSTCSFSSTLKEIVLQIPNTPSIQAMQNKAKAYEKLHDASKSTAYYPSLDLSYKGMYLKDKPVVYFNFPAPLPSNPDGIQIESQNQYSGALTLSYPLFTGFAIESKIESSRLKALKAKLATKDAKRNLYMMIVQAYGAAVSFKQLIASQKTALDSTRKSYVKAKAYYDLGMISLAQVYRVASSLHTMEATVIKTKNQYKVSLNQLAYLSHSKIDTVESLPNAFSVQFNKLEALALKNRPDLKSLKLIIKEQQSKIKLAQSQYYPTVGLFARAAYTGDGANLDGDGYTNKDKSAVGFVVKYNLFSGFKTKNEVEAAQAAKLASQFMLSSYKDKVKSELYQSYLMYQSFTEQLKASKARVKSAKAYEKLIRGEFENQITDADVLSRAIASSAMARAALIAVKVQVYTSYAKLLLEVSNNTFLKTLSQGYKK